MAETDSGDRLVVKVLGSDDGIVDGHDLGSFVRKPRQIRAVHSFLPSLSPHYVRLAGEWHGPEWAAYAMPYYAGEYVTAPLRGEAPDLPAFFRQLGAVYRTLTEHGYGRRQHRAPPAQFRAMHLDRLRRRLPVLREHLEPELLGPEPVVVNGRLCETLPGLLAGLQNNTTIQDSLQPALHSFPVHGDLNLGNLLVGPDGDFVVLDPRGVLRFWDPVYDFAKSLFSLTVFERAMTSGLVVSVRSDRAGRTSCQVALGDRHSGYLAAAIRFTPFLGQLPFVIELGRVDPAWRRRLFFSHAVHCLAEASCRLSDRKPRIFAGARGWEACRVLARGLYLVGLVLLNDLVTGADEIDPAEHLGWLADVPTAG